jgi:heavy metal sensor kinase
MSLRRWFRLRNTLASRLTLWYAGIFAVSSCIAFLLFYALIVSLILDQTDRELLDQANRFSLVVASQGTDSVVDSAIIESEAAGVKKVFFRFLSIDGHVFSSSNMSYWKNITIDTSALEELFRDKHPVFKTISIVGRKEQVRILYAQVGPRLILQVGQTMENYSRFLEVFRRDFTITMSLLIALAAGVGWFLARRAVSGIKGMTLTAQKISGGALDERVPVKSRGDEIDQLAMSFNRMLDRIEELLKEIKEMGDNIAHDLKSPVARIRGAAEVTLTSGKTLDEFESMAASTIEECDRLLDMINTMLLISKTESGSEKLAVQDIDLSDAVRQALELFSPMAEDAHVDLEMDVPDGIRLKGNTSTIQRMISNLIDNALKYTLSGGKVRVRLRETGLRAVITIMDTGVGISAADLPRIFDRFYRCDQSRSRPGTGLGLSLARAIARVHGGDITVTSTPGSGSTFVVELPQN